MAQEALQTGGGQVQGEALALDGHGRRGVVGDGALEPPVVRGAQGARGQADDGHPRSRGPQLEQRAEAAQLDVVRAATTSIDTWSEHIRHMDMLRLGTLSPEDATRMWVSMWQQGVRDLDAYRLADRRTGRLEPCLG